MSTNNEMKTKLENALQQNRQMQIELVAMKEKLEKLLNNVKDSYKLNEVLIKDGIIRRRRKGVGIKGAYLKGSTFYLKGNMFFKDIKCRNCPNNRDYEERKQQGEMFPMDLNLKSRHVWSTQDKQKVVLGIKEQIVDYLAQRHPKPKSKNQEINSEKLAKLLTMVPKDFRIDWDHISSSNLLHRHSAKTCEAIWNLFLHPSLKRTAWTEEENQKLLDVAKKYNFQNWPAIANEVGKRSDFQCFVQYQNYVCYLLPESSSKWTKEDDDRLREVIAKNMVNGIINWSNVNAHFPHKAKTTLHTRYNYTLNPAISHGAQFTPEEDLLLIAAVKEYGTKFNCIPRTLFPNRSLVQLRAHYKNVLAKRHNHHPWTLEDDIKLMDFVTEHGTKEWLQCENYFDGKHSRTSCRTRFLTIKRHLDKNPDSSLQDIKRKQQGPKHNAINIENWKEKVEELSTNPEGVDLSKKSDNKKIEEKVKKSQKVQKSNNEKRERTKSTKLKKPPEEIKQTKEEIMEPIVEIIQPAEQQITYYENSINNTEQSLLDVDETQLSKLEIQPVEENLQINENTLTSKTVTKRKARNKTPKDKHITEKLYIPTLRANALRNYHYFRYAYNLKMQQHPCDNIQVINNDFSVTLSALNPQFPFLLENYEFDCNIPEQIQEKIRTSSAQLSTIEKLQRLPPNWSTAMGFRALCIQTANVTSYPAAEQMQTVNVNPYVAQFRQRLRTLFYSTALLSRLNPSMVGITTTENVIMTEKPVAVKRKRSNGKKDNEEKINNKRKCIEVVETIKTELET